MSSSSPTPPSGEDVHTHAEQFRKGITTAWIDTHADDVSGPLLSILEEIPLILCVFQTDGTVAYANAAFCSCLGKTKPETLKSSLFSLLPRNDRKRFIQYVESLSPQQPVREFEYRVPSKGGEARWYQWTLKALFDGGDSPVFHILAGSDITLLKGTEDDLIDALEKYATLFESAHDAIILIDRHRLIDCNTAALRTFRISDKEVFLQGGLRDFSSAGATGLAQAGKDFSDHIEQALNTSMDRFQQTFGRGDGSVFPADVILSPFPLGSRRIVVAVVRDISELKKTEEALRKARDGLEEKVSKRTKELREANEMLTREVRERLQAEKELKASEERHRRISEELDVVLNGITDIILLSDADRRIIWANRALSQAAGLTPEEVLGRTCFETLCKKISSCEVCPVVQAIQTGKTVGGEMNTPDGSLWEITGYPVRDQDGRIRGAIGIIRDITGRRMIEDEARKRSILDSLGALAGGIAHDFNNILTVIMGNVSFAKMLLNSKGRVYGRLDDIEKASLRAKDLTSQLVTFSGWESPRKRPVAVDQLLGGVTHDLLQNSDISARFHIAGDLWKVDADEAQLGLVIRNIVRNAQEAMPHGGTLTVSAENCGPDESDGLSSSGCGHVKISFQDTGCGIEEHDIGDIFDPFFTTKRKGGGLGLAASHSVMQRHGGSIIASSEPGKGTTVTLYLPASDRPLQGESCEPREALAGRGRILFMDDEEFIRELAMSVLSHLGYQPTLARDGSEVIEKYKRALQEGSCFDAVILDLTVVEGMGGKECIRELRKIDPEVRAIVSSGHFNDPVTADPQKYGFSAFIAKPYNIQVLSAVLKRTIEGIPS